MSDFGHWMDTARNPLERAIAIGCLLTESMLDDAGAVRSKVVCEWARWTLWFALRAIDIGRAGLPLSVVLSIAVAVVNRNEDLSPSQVRALDVFMRRWRACPRPLADDAMRWELELEDAGLPTQHWWE